MVAKQQLVTLRVQLELRHTLPQELTFLPLNRDVKKEEKKRDGQGDLAPQNHLLHKERKESERVPSF